MFGCPCRFFISTVLFSVLLFWHCVVRLPLYNRMGSLLKNNSNNYFWSKIIIDFYATSQCIGFLLGYTELFYMLCLCSGRGFSGSWIYTNIHFHIFVYIIMKYMF